MRSCRFRWLYWLPLATALQAEPVPDLAEVNPALRSWIQLIDADRPYLLLDRQEGRIVLLHGGAALRTCEVIEDSLATAIPHRGTLSGQLRRYRPAHPWATPSSGPFDWEQVLANEAGDDAALLFSNQLLIYASEVWERPRAPAVRVGSADLRALANGLAKGTHLVILPPGWKRDDDRR